MDQLGTYAALAEIFSATAIVGGALFALVQLAEYKRRRRDQAAAELCRQFTQPELARAVNLIKSLPDDVSMRDLQAMDSDYEEAAQLMGMTFETMGLLVHKDMASFSTVQELTGGLLLMMWRKTRRWIVETRVEHNNPRFGEWIQWLAERVEENEGDMTPAYELHANWKKSR